MSNKVIELLSEELASVEEMRISDPKFEADYSLWGMIECQRTEDGSWKIWFVLSKFGLQESEIVEEGSKITDAQQFLAEFVRCGKDYGINPDSAQLLAML